MKQDGTMVVVRQSCNRCSGFTWISQPYVFGRFLAGNILLSFSTLMAGVSISRVLLMFRHMGLSAYSPQTYFSHQRKLIFPTVIKNWNDYRREIVEKLKTVKDAVWCGDGRFNSMGHSAKYGAYTMLSTTLMKIVHFELVQVSQFYCRTINCKDAESSQVKPSSQLVDLHCAQPILKPLHKTFLFDTGLDVQKLFRNLNI